MSLTSAVRDVVRIRRSRGLPVVVGGAAVVLAGCSSDPCASLCVELAREVDACHAAWGTTWDDLGASTRAAWRATCQDDWAIVRADMEPRQVSAAEDACATTSDALAEQGCDELRAVYVLGD